MCKQPPLFWKHFFLNVIQQGYASWTLRFRFSLTKIFLTGVEVNGCPVVPDNQNYDGATKLCSVAAPWATNETRVEKHNYKT